MCRLSDGSCKFDRNTGIRYCNVNMKKSYKKSNRVPTTFFVVAGLLVLGVTGFMLSDAGKKFYEPESRATEGCPPSSYNCSQNSFDSDYSCFTSSQVAWFCCIPPNQIEKLNGVPYKCSSGETPTPTNTPPANLCSAPNTCEPAYLCGNPATEGDCAAGFTCCRPTTPTPTDGGGVCSDPLYQCISENTCDNDVITIGSTKGPSCGQGKSCCKPPGVGTPTPTTSGGGGTPTPTTSGGGGGGGGGFVRTAPCVVYGLNYPASMCTNSVCPVPASLCQEKDFATSTHVKCVLPASVAGKVRIYSCCTAGQVLQGGKCVTVAVKPEVVTKSPATAITKKSAKIAGEVTADGGSTITERGFVYSATDKTPEIGSGSTKKTVAGKVGEFSLNLTQLAKSKKYYFRAYAKNAKGLTYGAVKSFKTLGDQVTAPDVDTQAATDVTQTGAKLNGDVVSDGGSAITERGFVYSKTELTPTIANATKNVVTGTVGEYASTLTGLPKNTTHYFRAYAKNAKGTVYGEVLTFKTGTTTPTVTITHTPSDTGFSEEPLLYIGAILYGIGVIAFVSARYFGAARRKSL